MTPRLAAALPLLLMPLFAACSGESGGCGGPPAETAAPPPPAGKAPAGGGSSGFGAVALAPKKRKAKGPGADTARGQLEEAVVESEAAKTAPIPETGNRGFETQVRNAKKPVLVFVTGAGCEECEWLSPAVDRAAARARAEFDSYRLDAFSTGATSLLPGGMKPLPLPKLLLFEKGKAISRREGLPFARDKNEPLDAYQKRLARWLSAALAQKNLAFGGK